MREAILERFFYGSDWAPTMGVLRLQDGPTIFTCEDDWKDNAVGKSCIPDGEYLCEARRFNRGGYDAIEITGVPGRTHILFHKGNTEEDVQGCIVVGESFGVVHGQVAVATSGVAFDRLMGWFAGETFLLRIEPAAGLAGAPWPS